MPIDFHFKSSDCACGSPATQLCDGKVDEGTCDRPMCLDCVARVRRQLKACFQKGLNHCERGAVVALPIGEGEFQKLMFVSESNLSLELGADVDSTDFQQALAIVQSCKLDRQVAVIAIDRDTEASPSGEFIYHSFLFNIGDD